MSFKKYNSIENSYRQKYITKVFNQYPEMKDTKFCIHEKLDGANIQLLFTPGSDYPQVGKRNSFLKHEESFYDIWNTLDHYNIEIGRLQHLSNTLHTSFRFYGELFGQGVQKRVNYGPNKYISLFELEVDNTPVTQQFLDEFMYEYGLHHLLPPRLGYVDGIINALEFNENFDSKVLNIENNPAEGIIIRPYAKIFVLENNVKFLLKKKSEKFGEKENKNKTQKAPESNEFIKSKLEFNTYITDNRLQGIFSKYGPIQDMKQFGLYIKLMLDDAKEDFIKDYDISGLSDKELKNIFKSAGKQIAIMLKFYI